VVVRRAAFTRLGVLRSPAVVERAGADCCSFCRLLFERSRRRTVRLLRTVSPRERTAADVYSALGGISPQMAGAPPPSGFPTLMAWKDGQGDARNISAHHSM